MTYQDFETLAGIIGLGNPITIEWENDFIDGMIQQETCKMDDRTQCTNYEKSLFETSEALPLPCSERAVVYNCFVMAGLIADLVGKYSNGQDLPKELIVDLMNFTLYGGLE